MTVQCSGTGNVWRINN